MIKVTVNTNAIRKSYEVDPSTTTVRQVLTMAGLDYNRFTVHMFGDVVTADMLDKTLVQCDVYEDVTFSSVTKADSAC